MVLFTTKFFRKLYRSKFGSVYVNKIVQLLLKQSANDAAEIEDDDLRGNSILFTERIGRYDGLSSIYRVPKTGTTIDYWVATFPDKAFIEGWWIFDHVNHNYSNGAGYVRDMSYNDRDARSYGNPCIVSGGSGLVLPWLPDMMPSIVTDCDGVDDHYRVTNITDFQVGTQSFSWVGVFYPQSFAKVDKYSNWTLGFTNVTDEDQYVDGGAATSHWSKSFTKFSLSMWVKWTNGGIEDFPGDPAYNGYRTVFGLADDNDNDEVSIYFVDKEQSGLSYDSIGTDITNDGYATVNQRYSSAEAKNGVWYHIMLVYDSTLGSANLKLYINGVLQSSAQDVNATGDTINIDAITHLFIGKYNVDDINEFGGQVKDFRWWSDVALTQTDVTNQFLGNENSVAQPSVFWSMNEAEGTSMRDDITGQTATLVNGVRWVYDDTYPCVVLIQQNLLSKRDDSSNKYTMWIDTDGTLYASVREGGTITNKKISAPLSLNTWVWIVVTYDTSTNTLKIYKNAVDVTTTTGTNPPLENSNLGSAFNDLWFCSSAYRGSLFTGAIYLIGFEGGGAMSSTEVTNLFNNKATLTDLTASQVAVVNYCIPQ